RTREPSLQEEKWSWPLRPPPGNSTLWTTRIARNTTKPPADGEARRRAGSGAGGALVAGGQGGQQPVGRRQPADQPTDQPLGQPTSTRITPTAMIAIPAIMRGVSGSFQIARASSATSAIPTATQIPYATPTGIPADSAAARNANETR